MQALQRVAEKRAPIPHHVEVFLGVLRADRGLALLRKHLLLAPVLARIRPPEQKGHGDGGNAHGQAGGKAGGVLWFLAGEVDVAAHDAAHVADADEQRHADGALGRRRQTVADPRDEARKRAVQACGHGEEEAVGDARVAWLGNGELGDEAADGDGIATLPEIGRAHV